ncbi:MAG TPA: protein-disulfide reductase DsbD domain-containing protein [Patescibacteria group bacterium]|nr:protein-disulfide reductase DsbD domain-containing protein [Patescibacteria group bacterium]
MKRFWIMAGAMAAVLALAQAAGAQMSQGMARTVVAARGYVSLEPVPRGRTFEVAVIARIKPLFHINAHKVLDEFLIPTEVNAKTPAGFRITSTEYPAGELKQFSFSPKKLAVYTGQMIVKMKVEAGRNAPLGARELPLSLRYQACNNTYCLSPVTVPLSVHLTVARAGSAAKAVHPEIFHR